jgi:repressor LexA
MAEATPRKKLPQKALAYCRFQQYLRMTLIVRTAKLTVRQKQVLAFVEERRETTGSAPTLQETAEYFGFRSLNAVRQHLRLIEQKGFVQRVPRKSRGVIVVRVGKSDPDTIRVPLLGRIPAGHPLAAEEDIEEQLVLPCQLYRGRELFALRVRGDSMNGAGILSGDVAVLDASTEARDGSIAAVIIESEATLKRVYRRPTGLLLKPENPAFQTIEISVSDAEDVRIAGVLVGILRKV